MRIISWNIDGIGRRYKDLIQLAEEYQPDIIFLQKTKNQHGNANFPIEGYRQLWWFGDSAPYSGVATYCNLGEVEFSKEERKIAKDILTKGILSYHRNWQNGIAALIQKPYAENENAFDRSMEITRMARDFYKEAMRLENLYDKILLASGIAMLLNEGNLTSDDLEGLSEETQKHLLYKARKMRE